MSLIVALKYTEGTVLVSDRRTMWGDIKREGQGKLETLTKDIGITSVGLTGAAEDMLKAVRAFCGSTSPASFDNIVSYLSDAALEWYKKNYEKLAEEDQEEAVCSFLLVSPDRIRKIMGRGYSEEVYDYDCDGSGIPYAEYILANHHRTNLTEEEAKQLAAYTIVETSKIDANVSDDIDLLVCRKEKGCELINRSDAEDLRLRSVPLPKTAVEEQSRTVEKIVELRGSINDLFQAKFKFKLFHLSERAAFQLMKQCRSEGEFTSNISALALLIDQTNVSEMKKLSGENEGSINILQKFLSQHIGELPSEIIQTFRDIMTIRSKKFPIHSTDSKFVEVVVRLMGQYPPKWSDLYLKCLNMYEKSLNELVNYLIKAEKPKEQTEK